jgi:tyrosyl-tRNA synthetase
MRREDELRSLLDEIADTREVVLRRSHSWSATYDMWIDAREDARDAYCTWRTAPTAETYAVYRAAQDREDAAQDTLAYTQTSRMSVS